MNKLLQRVVAQNPRLEPFFVTMSERPFYTAAWTKTKESGVTVYIRPCRLCGGPYVFGYGCRMHGCATGAI